MIHQYSQYGTPEEVKECLAAIERHGARPKRMTWWTLLAVVLFCAVAWIAIWNATWEQRILAGLVVVLAWGLFAGLSREARRG